MGAMSARRGVRGGDRRSLVLVAALAALGGCVNGDISPELDIGDLEITTVTASWGFGF